MSLGRVRSGVSFPKPPVLLYGDTPAVSRLKTSGWPDDAAVPVVGVLLGPGIFGYCAGPGAICDEGCALGGADCLTGGGGNVRSGAPTALPDAPELSLPEPEDASLPPCAKPLSSCRASGEAARPATCKTARMLPGVASAKIAASCSPVPYLLCFCVCNAARPLSVALCAGVSPAIVGCLANAIVAGWSDATCTGCDGLWGHELDAGCSGPGELVTAAAPALSCTMVAAAAFAFAFTIAMFSASAVSCTVGFGSVSAEPEPLSAGIAVANAVANCDAHCCCKCGCVSAASPMHPPDRHTCPIVEMCCGCKMSACL